jgi:hypothetical protein
MPKTDRIVINTGPILALIAGLGNLNILNSLILREAINKMQAQGVRLSEQIIIFALNQVSE